MTRRFLPACLLGLGFGLAGCGIETTPDPAPLQPTNPPAAPGGDLGGMAGKEGGGAMMGGPPPAVGTKDKADAEGEQSGPGGMPKGYPAGGPEAKEGANPASPDEKKDEAPKAAAVTLTEDEIATIKKLDPVDAEAALAQKICLVSEEEDGSPTHLGGMGTPIKQEINGKTVFLCCKGCIDELKANPEKYLAKLGK